MSVMKSWREPKNLTGLDMAFPASVSELMPTWEEIPDEFKRHLGTKWNRLFSDWFYHGLKSLRVEMAEGIEQAHAVRTLRAIIGSFESKHEHKEAASAYLMSLWFKDAEWEKGDGGLA